MNQKTIIILGGGIGGIVAARELRKHLGHNHRIILVDRLSYHAFQPSFLWVSIGWRTPAMITKPFSALAKYGIEFIQANVISVDSKNQKIFTSAGHLNFDYLIIALGAENEFINDSANAKNRYSYYNFEGCVELSKIIPTFSGGRIIIKQRSENIKYPFSPFDAAFLLSTFYSKREIENINISIISPHIYPIPFISKEQNNHLLNLLDEFKIKFISSNKDSQPEEIIPNSLTINIPSIKPPTISINKDFLDDEGWINAEKKTLQTIQQNIYAIGDCNKIGINDFSLLPKIGVYANKEAEVVAYNIAQEINGHAERKEFSGYGFFFIETGSGRAIYFHGNLTNNPTQPLSMIEQNVTFHWSKVVLEKYWLWRWL